MENYNSKLDSFSERIKNANHNIPIQEIRQKEKKEEDEVQLNVWMPKSLMLSLKRKALDEEKSLKEIVNDAITKHLG